MKTEAQILGHKKQSLTVQNRWKDPDFRKRMIEAQKKIGYRNYGDGIFYSINSKRYK